MMLYIHVTCYISMSRVIYPCDIFVMYVPQYNKVTAYTVLTSILRNQIKYP